MRLPNGITEIGRMCFFSSKTTSLCLPNTVINLCQFSMADYSLIQLELNDTLKYFHPAAFVNLTLEKLVFPAQFNYFSERTLSNLKGIRILIFNAPMVTFESFNLRTNICDVYCNSYKSIQKIHGNITIHKL